MAIRSRRGEVTVRARMTRRSPVGTVFLSFAFPDDVPTNVVTNPKVDPATDTSEFKVAAVHLEKTEAPKTLEV